MNKIPLLKAMKHDRWVKPLPEALQVDLGISNYPGDCYLYLC